MAIKPNLYNHVIYKACSVLLSELLFFLRDSAKRTPTFDCKLVNHAKGVKRWRNYLQ